MSACFISDLHLSDARLELIRAFCLLLARMDQQGCEKLYILGDFFEAYIGDDYEPEWMEPINDALKKFNSPVKRTYFLHGNRDFLVGETWAAKCGCLLLPEQYQVELDGIKLFLCHGDEFCVDDVAYQQFRALVRSPQWQQQTLALPITERLQLARKLRDDSRSQSSEKASYIMDVNQGAISERLAQEKADLLIHGHTHRPNLHLNDKTPRLVLGDWDEFIWYAFLNMEEIRQYATSVSDLVGSNWDNVTQRHHWQIAGKQRE
ncbi:UDP-2,3-diacylglucosamine diphosphatase [Maribrevibacterium harenarium]|uniref:UDP-2,3-diacylglucosamine hydrolase n=1 Tax=Maribrevibacterium harenarium TaxID=2589817 RepID=A0A501X596_9GAMM|nr:UDP-2,3-diacylglucosamine diphosphatase [Maribrevibacterium harenarium]TPE55692.1 UDP-2,3-diacylglucosamine diphosphatase [Maribrevibacterium harenarium]